VRIRPQVALQLAGADRRGAQQFVASDSRQASAAAAVAWGQAKLRCRARTTNPSVTASSIRMASPHARSPASPQAAPGPADPALVRSSDAAMTDG
jgi:hypothetical protein